MGGRKGVARHICYILRRDPGAAGVEMDCHGWVSVQGLIDGINAAGLYTLDRAQLEEIVQNDDKGRYRFDEAHERIRACQGHAAELGVTPILSAEPPPEHLYHGTTAEAWALIQRSGSILKMDRHAVHMQADEEKARRSALRWRKEAVVLKIAAARMAADGVSLGRADNGVWCAERVPVEYVCGVLQMKEEERLR